MNQAETIKKLIAENAAFKTQVTDLRTAASGHEAALTAETERADAAELAATQARADADSARGAQAEAVTSMNEATAAKLAAEKAQAEAEASQTKFDEKVAAKATELSGKEPALEDGVTTGGGDPDGELTREQADEQLAAITDPGKRTAFRKRHRAALLSPLSAG